MAGADDEEEAAEEELLLDTDEELALDETTDDEAALLELDAEEDIEDEEADDEDEDAADDTLEEITEELVTEDDELLGIIIDTDESDETDDCTVEEELLLELTEELDGCDELELLVNKLELDMFDLLDAERLEEEDTTPCSATADSGCFWADLNTVYPAAPTVKLPTTTAVDIKILDSIDSFIILCNY